jgi:hypothetical protein
LVKITTNRISPMNDSPSHGEGWNRMPFSALAVPTASSFMPIPHTYVSPAHPSPYTHTTHQ